MKNLLFATSAIIALGGTAAFAQEIPSSLTISGSAELGVTYTDIDGVDLINDGVDFVGDYGIDFTFNATSDTGIAFGANVEVENGAGDDIDDFNVFVSGAFGTLTLGDIDSAYDAATVGIQTGGLADEADYYFSDAGLDGSSDGNLILRYDYTVAGVTLSGSIEQGDGAVFDNIYAGGVDWSGSFGGTNVTLGAAVQGTTTDDAGGLGDGDHLLISVSGRAGFGSFGVNAFFENWDGPSDSAFLDSFQTYAGSVDFTSGAVTVGANVVIRDGDVSNESYGAFAEYDLGGGLSLVAAAGFGNTATGVGATTSNFASDGEDIFTGGLGFAMSF